MWEPGSQHGYHATTYGWLVGEVIRRISGRSVGAYFHDEVATPLGLDAWIGLPDAEEPRVAMLVGWGGGSEGSLIDNSSFDEERAPRSHRSWGPSRSSDVRCRRRAARCRATCGTSVRCAPRSSPPRTVSPTRVDRAPLRVVRR